MSNLLDQLRLVAEQIIRTAGYPGIGFLMFIENIFPPIPSEVVMPFAGFLVDRGEMSFGGVLIAGTIGALLGAVAIFYVGYRFGEKRLRNWLERYGRYLLLSPDDLDSSLQTFADHGKKMVLFGRLIPAVRSLISIPAGLEKMGLAIFLLFTLIGTAIWNLVLTGGGLLLGRNWERVLEWVDAYSTVIYTVLGGLLLVYLVRRIKKRLFSD